MLDFDKSKIKPSIYNKDFCKILGIPYKRQHYKCYILKKYKRVSYTQKKKIHKFLCRYIKDNNFDEYIHSYYYFPQWKISKLLDYLKENNLETIADVKHKIYISNYSDYHIYLNFNKPIEEIKI